MERRRRQSSLKLRMPGATVDNQRPCYYVDCNFELPNILSKGYSIMAAGIMEIEDSSFDSEVVKSDKPVVVDFWAPWCGPCKAIGPILDELANSYGDKMKFTKCNVDDNPVTPGKFGIKAIPTLIFFKNGEVADQITGMVAKSKLEEAIDNVLS
jgi:thioredoxin 1